MQSDHVKDLNRIYAGTEYEETAPDTGVGRSIPVYKFRSMSHFIGWTEELAKFPRETSKDSSDNDDVGFTLAYSLENAFKVVRDTTFDTKNTTRLQGLIRKLKNSTAFREEGYEIEVPEYLAGSTNHWVDNKSRRSASKVINDTLFIDGTYHSGMDAETMKKKGVDLLLKIYEMGVIPRKMVVVYSGKGWNNDMDDTYHFLIDVSFSDLNGIAKAVHPSTFRRLTFRLEEMYSGLTGGYGRNLDLHTSQGYFSMQRGSASDDEVKKFLGIIDKR